MTSIKIKDFFYVMPEKQFNSAIHISPKLNFIYFSIPKNACSTITVLLRSKFESDLYKIKSKVHDRNTSSLLRPCDIGYDKFIELLESNSVFKFTVIRNPYSRILSAYINKFVDSQKRHIEAYKSFLKNLVPPELKSEYIENRDLTFIEFLNFVHSQKPYQMNAHWRPQFSQAFMDLVNYSAVYKFEELNTCLQELFDQLNKIGCYSETSDDIDSLIYRPHKTNADQMIDRYYTNECINTFQEIYAVDLEKFNYSYPLSDMSNGE